MDDSAALVQYSGFSISVDGTKRYIGGGPLRGYFVTVTRDPAVEGGCSGGGADDQPWENEFGAR